MILRFRIAFITTILCSICSALDVHCDAVGSMGRRAAMDLFRTVSCNKVALRCHSSLPLLAQSL
ncbi:unnamed protein product [Durusdinium trenchii]|uniref:Secreted protein n=1 Tax=Durusdinium trenchii TaxID=1381693 RepID=A0ABP0RVS7_9DINO